MSRNTSILHYQLADFLSGSQEYLVGWSRIRPGEPPTLHDHDFVEFFWVDAGQCRHLHSEGAEWLEEGDLRFVRPEQVHGFEVKYGEAELINLALPATFLESWAQMYPRLRGRYFWREGAVPDGFRLREADLTRMRGEVSSLSLHDGNIMALHRVLLQLLLDQEPEVPDAACPHWLQRGLQRVGRREVFEAGVPGFTRACGRSTEHVSRSCRQFLGKTPGQIVNQARMRHAAHRLRMTDDDVLTIMMDCGLSNPSHFYRLFRDQYGTTPRQYRLLRWQ